MGLVSDAGFRIRHDHLIEVRNTLLAHNDLSQHRTMLAWPRFHNDQPAIVEARSPIKAQGAREVRELFRFQEKRFGVAAQQLANHLQEQLAWRSGDEIDLDAELTRLRQSSRP